MGQLAYFGPCGDLTPFVLAVAGSGTKKTTNKEKAAARRARAGAGSQLEPSQQGAGLSPLELNAALEQLSSRAHSLVASVAAAAADAIAAAAPEGEIHRVGPNFGQTSRL